MEHTKEPWHTGKNHNAERFIYGEDGWAIAECVQTKDKMFANARRIVASVNACAGIPIEHLEAMRGTSILNSAVKSSNDDKKKRDELLFALQEISKMTYDEWTNGVIARDIALSAIEKAKATS